ncbi:MAG TPA: UDP-glucose 4-epimerase GalE [Pseudogracilibacillus sp.]|nr:UDP-glucose 4-epimerase GalE [Pseudogracilibacillus sp.]
MTVLLTGGAGYIGSHTAVELLEKNHDVVIVDNLSNSSKQVITNIEEITGKKPITYYIDLLDKENLRKVFFNHKIDAVIHFAGYKSVTESVELPLSYYKNNVTSTIVLCEVMEEFHVYKLIFSSSATVYGTPEKLPITEDTPTETFNPYGNTKLVCEEVLQDVANTNNAWKISILRYFNPAGAHPSGRIGEKPNGKPNNLMPYITQVATGEHDCVKVFGNDYNTRDGSGIRDYIHVVDLVQGHIAALNCIEKHENIDFFNLGTGRGYTVLEVIETFEKASGQVIPYEIVDRRNGDVAISFADPSKTNDKLSWRAKKSLFDMCKDSWRWESQLNRLKIYN